jgi:hypothetical protein
MTRLFFLQGVWAGRLRGVCAALMFGAPFVRMMG